MRVETVWFLHYHRAEVIMPLTGQLVQEVTTNSPFTPAELPLYILFCGPTQDPSVSHSRHRKNQERLRNKRQVIAYSGNTENGSIRRWAKMAGWFIDSQYFSQVLRSSWVEAIIIERREFGLLYMWINGQPMTKNKRRRNVVRFRNSQNKASSVVLNLL